MNIPLYVSVTSIHSHQEALIQTLKSIRTQSLLPNKCYIYLSTDSNLFDDGFPHEEITNHELNRLIENHSIFFEVIWTKDIGPYTKLIPILKDKWNEDCLIVTIDDIECIMVNELSICGVIPVEE